MSKAAASRLIALVAAAAVMLAVFGCGGDSATETAGAPPSSGASSEGTQETASSKRDSESPKPAQEGEGAGGLEGEDTGAAGGKQGPAITPPKGPQERTVTPKERAEATVVSMSLTSPALQPGAESVAVLPAAYTCDGKDTWPALRWGGVPKDTAELALTVLSLEPVNEALFFNWALAGLDPKLTELESGRLPPGAAVGRNSFGKTAYSICPSKKGPETYFFTLYALPERLGARQGFDPAALRKEILAISGNAGILATSYTR